MTMMPCADVAIFAELDHGPSTPSGVAPARVTIDFQQLVSDHYGGLYRFAMSMAKRRETAEDLVQQTFLQWAKKGEQLRDVSKAKSWLYTTLYRDWLRIAKRDQKHPEVEFEPELHAAPTEDAELPDVDAATLMSALGELDERYRAPLTLFYLRELSYREIADTLDVPIGTVMSRLSRAKDALRAQLKLHLS
jgi:RNA polymerase sigma factor (sigma-70 family)